jgi:hypothetical protein
MVTSLTHSRNASDEPILHSLDQHLQSLSPNQKAGLAIAALYTAIKPKNTSVSVNCDCSKLISAVELLLQLSVPGKLALTRAIAEELAVLEQLEERKG